MNKRESLTSSYKNGEDSKVCLLNHLIQNESPQSNSDHVLKESKYFQLEREQGVSSKMNKDEVNLISF